MVCGNDSRCGTVSPAGNTNELPAATVCSPALTHSWSPSTRTPSSSPWPEKFAGASTWISVEVSKSTVVVCRNTGNSGPLSRSPPCARHASSRNTTGTAMAVSLSQYWNACTNVTLRIPPDTTFTVTTTATISPPNQSGAPVTVCSVRPAPLNCGSRYSHAMAIASPLATRRTTGEENRASAKSGSVYAPDRRSGAATSVSSTR